MKESIPVFSLVAWSGTGKTTYLEALVPCLNALGLRVAVVKHDGHDFDIDHEGTDTDRLTKSGAAVTAILSKRHGAVLYNQPMTPEEFVAQITGVDLIITEGFKNGMWPKILFYRSARGGEPAVVPDESAAIVTDKRFFTDTPQFDLDAPADLARFLKRRIQEREENENA